MFNIYLLNQFLESQLTYMYVKYRTTFVIHFMKTIWHEFFDNVKMNNVCIQYTVNSICMPPLEIILECFEGFSFVKVISWNKSCKVSSLK